MLDGKILFTCTHSNYPCSAFEYVQGGAHEGIVSAVTAQPQYTLMVERMAPVSSHRQRITLQMFTPITSAKWTVSGNEYQLGDAVYRIGAVTQGTNLKAVTVEVRCCRFHRTSIQIEYEPLMSCRAAAAILTQLAGYLINPPPSKLTQMDVMSQYLAVFAALRPTQQQQQPTTTTTTTTAPSPKVQQSVKQ